MSTITPELKDLIRRYLDERCPNWIHADDEILNDYVIMTFIQKLRKKWGKPAWSLGDKDVVEHFSKIKGKLNLDGMPLKI